MTESQEYMLKNIPIYDCFEPLEEVSDKDFILEPAYFKSKISSSPKILLRSRVIKKLKIAKEALQHEHKDWNFKIWDGFRTLDVQTKLYKAYFDELKAQNPSLEESKICEMVEIFVAAPSFDKSCPSQHNTGGCIDLTLVDETGKEIPMGTAFDEFNEKSFTDHFKNESDSIFHKNRELLRRILESSGFVNYEKEWWHFNYGDQRWAYKTSNAFAIYGSMEL